MTKIKEFQNQPEEKIKVEQQVKSDKRNKIIQAKEFLESNYDIKLNLDTKEIEWKHKAEKEFKIIDDQTFMFIKLDIMMNTGINLTKDDLDMLLSAGYFFESYHPFKDYLSRLPKWDEKTDYIAQWCRQVQVLDEGKYRIYFTEGFKKWFVGAVMSLITDVPNMYNTNQICMVFTGPQGKYKSTFFNNLLPSDMKLRYFYTGKYDFHSEEHQKYLGTKVFIDLAELEGFTRGDTASIKARITQPQVSLRFKWGRKETYLKRRASFCGSTNDQQFLTDISGDRRFIVIPIERISIDNTLNVDNIYAQAFALYKKGFKYWLDEEEIQVVNMMNNDFRRLSQEEEMLRLHFRKPTDEDYNFPGRVEYLTPTQISNWLTETYKRLNVNDSVNIRIGKILNKMGYKSHSKRLNGLPAKMYGVIKITNPEITSYDNNIESKIIDEVI